MNYKKIKKDALKSIKNNYFKSVIIVFISLFLISGGIELSSKNILNVDITDIKNIEKLKKEGKTNSQIIDDLLEKTMETNEHEEVIKKKYTNGILSLLINEITSTKSVIFSLLNGLNEFLGGKASIGVVILISNIILILFRTVFISVLEVGKNRFFLEQRRYLKTGIDRLLYPYKKKRNFHLASILFLKNIYLFLWSFTIIGFFIKYYEYKMITYLLAENPNLTKKEVFKLSRDLSNGNKLNMFKLDLILLLYKIPGLFTFNLTNIFFTNIYEETLYTETYMNLRNNGNYENLLNDNLLDIEKSIDDEYPEEKKGSIFNVNSLKNYSIDTYILFFFTFSIIGWVWEVILTLVQTGSYANRGTLYGPWLPIYGYGGVAILVLLKKWRKEPMKLFLLSVILCGIIEYGTSVYLELVNHLRYWDYSGYFLNINGRVCLEGLIVFGLAGSTVTYLLAPILDNFYQKININIKNILIVVLITLYTIDMTYATFFNHHSGSGITTEIIEVEN